MSAFVSTAMALLTHTLMSADSVTGAKFCLDSSDCVMLVGYTCQNSQCVCEPSRDLALFSCTQRSYGEKCRSDQDCYPVDSNLICAKSESRTCICRRGLVWDIVSKRCYLNNADHPFISHHQFDPIRDVIIPAVILMTLGATGWLCYRLFCNCGKNWGQRRRSREVSRALEEAQLPCVGTSQPTTWVTTSYRVFSSMNGVETRGGASFPPCLLLPVGPPPYEEALKHKVILSSYQPPVNSPPTEQAEL